jgi:hypothetical protein
MFRTPDDLVLQVFPEVIEIIAVAGDPDNKVPVFPGMFLSVAKGVGRNNIELNMMTIYSEITSDE